MHDPLDPSLKEAPDARRARLASDVGHSTTQITTCCDDGPIFGMDEPRVLARSVKRNKCCGDSLYRRVVAAAYDGVVGANDDAPMLGRRVGRSLARLFGKFKEMAVPLPLVS